MAEYEITQSFSNSCSRNEVRMRVIDKLSQELPGQGINALASRYTYYVENLIYGNRVYLRRPANLHNGFDFIVCVENINFNPNGRRRNYPTHDDIIEDLRAKYTEDPGNYSSLYNLLEQIYTCHDIDYTQIISFQFSSGYPVDMVLKTLKWLFIEQDIRYWNYSGRDMLWNGIHRINH